MCANTICVSVYCAVVDPFSQVGCMCRRFGSRSEINTPIPDNSMTVQRHGVLDIVLWMLSLCNDDRQCVGEALTH